MERLSEGNEVVSRWGAGCTLCGASVFAVVRGSAWGRCAVCRGVHREEPGHRMCTSTTGAHQTCCLSEQQQKPPPLSWVTSVCKHPRLATQVSASRRTLQSVFFPTPGGPRNAKVAAGRVWMCDAAGSSSATAGAAMSCTPPSSCHTRTADTTPETASCVCVCVTDSAALSVWRRLMM